MPLPAFTSIQLVKIAADLFSIDKIFKSASDTDDDATHSGSQSSFADTHSHQAGRQTRGDCLKEAQRLKDIRVTNSSNSPLVVPALWRPITVISAAYFYYGHPVGGTLYIPPLKCRVNSHHTGTIQTHVHLKYTSRRWSSNRAEGKEAILLL